MSSIEASLTLGSGEPGRLRGRTEGLRQLRNFGLLVGTGWAVVGIWPAIVRGGSPRVWALVLAVALLVPALIMPGVLRPVHRVWMAIGDVLGRINSRIILTVVFFAVVTPMGLIMRLVRADPLQRRFDPRVDTYRVVRKPRQTAHLRRQF